MTCAPRDDCSGDDCYHSPTQRLADPTLASSVGPIRIKFVYDLLTDGAGSGQCLRVGERIDPCAKRQDTSCPYTCTADDVITAEKKELLRELTSWVAECVPADGDDASRRPECAA